MIKSAILSLALLAAAGTVRADQPFNAAFWAPEAQVYPPSENITGVRLNFLYGENANVRGVDFGTGNSVTGDFAGIQFFFVPFIPCVYNNVNGTADGVQWGIVNRTGTKLNGLDLGWVNVNTTEASEINGAQLSFVNCTYKSDLTGVQIGVVNVARDVTGVQLGLVNYADRLRGVQIGLWNQVNSRGWGEFKPLPKVFPFINLGW